MRLNFVKLNPNGNITVLVTSPVPRAEQADVAARLMRGDVLRVEARNARGQAHRDGAELLRDVEQVGFVEPTALPGARVRLQMMGGEFCGNASMSLATLLAREGGLAVGAQAKVALEVSGADGPVCCRVERLGEDSFLGSASMPLPTEICEATLPGGACVPLVRFPGIAHLIVPEDSLSPAEAEARIPQLCEELDTDALGILLTAPEAVSMRPLVYVRSTKSAVWERGCGSGTAALGAWLASRAGGTASRRIAQPGGVIGVRAVCSKGSILEIEIEGEIRRVAEGVIQL